MTSPSVSVLFVCLGNICRSPTAQGVFEHLLAESACAGRVHTDSAGTQAYHVGEPPDSRSQAAALRRGVDLSAQRARRVSDEDFERFDYVLGMDSDNVAALLSRCPESHRSRVHHFLDFAPDATTRDVPDPYYGGEAGFERVLDLVHAASAGLIHVIERRLLTPPGT